jgi:hypothetical protein
VETRRWPAGGEELLDADADGGRLEERSPTEDLSEEAPDLLHL